MSCVNSFGDEQLAVDLLADKLLFEALKFSVRNCLTALFFKMSRPGDIIRETAFGGGPAGR